jgi:maltose alpha-D-glucosyltransferase/alpha-amylase
MKKTPAWLQDVFYQIDPQSFYDTNGDGIGEIPGIIEKLDYIQSIGCTALWPNPVFP